MGLILDSSVLVASERQGQNARQMLAAISREVSDTESPFRYYADRTRSCAARAHTPERKAKRQRFIQELLSAAVQNRGVLPHQAV